ncbi:MAG: hypothetical protein ACKOPP_06040 [Bacteroidota bacterium]
MITGRIDGIDNFVINYRQNDDDGTVVKSYSSELTFYDDGYQLLYSNLINNPNGFNAEVTVKIYDECCGNVVFEGIIAGDSVDWCEPECWVSANIIQKDEELSCIKNTIIWDNRFGFLNQNYNRVDYCVENRPAFIHAIVILFGALFQALITLIVGALIPIIFVIWGLVYVICLVVAIIPGGIGPGDCTTPGEVITDEVLDWLRQTNDALLPCTDFHIAPYVRDYIKNACRVCGLTFQSSILDSPPSPYYNLILLSMQVKKGRQKNSTNYRMIEDNLPIETLETLFRDYLNPMFNARWKVLNGNLIFERKDYFNGLSQWIDADQLLSSGKILENRICWNWTDRERYAYGRFEYQMDAMEYIGNEAKLQYNDLVDWNVPYNAAQTGEWNLTIPASPVRCVDDQFPSLFQTYFTLLADNQLLMAQHTAFNYKFLIYSNIPNRPIASNYSNSFIGNVTGLPPQWQRFNYPMWFVEGDPITGNGAQNNLYSLFHYIDNPRLPTATQFDFNFTFEFDCSQFLGFDFSKYIKISRGSLLLNGEIREIAVDFNRRTIEVKGTA